MFNKYLNTSKKRIIFIVLLFFFISLISLAYYKFYKSLNFGFPCFFRKITGFYCPGCGITRAIFSIFELDFKAALGYNLLIFLLAPFLIFYFFYLIKDWIMCKSYNTNIYSGKIWNWLLIITILFGILRNIDYFSFLAP